MTFTSYAEVEEKLGSRDSRKVGNNTYLQRRDPTHIAVRLHAIDVVTFDLNGIKLNTGGWFTPTTKDRINQYVPVFVFSERGVWYVGARFGDGPRTRYFDGIRLAYGTGDVLNPEDAPPNADAERHETERAIRRYVDVVKRALPIDAPSGGDCWFCAMRTEDGTPLGDKVEDTSHLTEHMAEGYVVPSLVYNAMAERRYGNVGLCYQMFAMSDRPDPNAVGRDVRRYLRKRLVRGN